MARRDDENSPDSGEQGQEPESGPSPERAGIIDERFATNVREWRERAQISQSELARRMSTLGWPFHPQTMQRVEGGQRKVSVGEAKSIAQLLNTTVETLMMPTEEANTEAWFNMFTGRAAAAFEQIASWTSSLLFARDHLERGIESAERRGLDKRERILDAIREAQAALAHATPKRAVEVGHQDYKRDYGDGADGAPDEDDAGERLRLVAQDPSQAG